MKFLVILLALVVNHYWRRDRDMATDRWFVRFHDWFGQRIRRFSGQIARHPVIYPALILLLPSAVLAVVLLLVNGVVFGLLTLIIHVGVLLALFDRVNGHVLSARYLALWRAENYEGAFLLLQTHWRKGSLDNCADRATLHEEFCRLLLASYFERLFAVVFWYLVLGPAGALFYHLAVLYRDRVCHEATEEGEVVLRLVYLLEWVPARLLAVTFSLAGDFVGAFARLRGVALDRDRSAVNVIHTCALAALGSSERMVLVQEVGERGSAPVKTVLIDTENAIDGHTLGLRAAWQVEELLSLLERSQVVWISILALLTLYGVGS